MLVHRTSIADDDAPVALQLLREQTGRMLYPVHRIDRPSSGVLLFAHSAECTQRLQQVLASEASHKIYTALVRGWMPETIDSVRDVKNDKGALRTAETRFALLKQIELPMATDRYATARFSIVEAELLTGRWHQIRQHLAQLRHYIINDRVHGDGKQNRLFAQQLGINHMFLHATRLSFTHPYTRQSLRIEAPFPEHWESFF